MVRTRRIWAASPLLAAVLWTAGCDEKPSTPTRVEPSAAPAPPPTQRVTPPDPLAGLIVDDMGAFLKDERVDLSAKDAQTKLRTAIGKLPVKSAVVPLRAERNAKTQDVEVVVNALGDAGAALVDLKTPGRDGKVNSLKVTPEARISLPVPECTAVAMVKKDSTSAVWQKKGGTAVKFSKGLAGPDLSMTVDGLGEKTKSCSSPIWLLAGENGVSWGLVWDLGERASTSTDPQIRPTLIGLLREAPVAGRPVALAHEKGGAAR